uniref:Uncharacterized protein n=1 Tax=Anguilla anguilla TaxID=7936 RepID=A0A0E9UAC4_ANGAN
MACPGSVGSVFVMETELMRFLLEDS